jgi:carboxyl-terminal processing protease
MQKKSHYSPIAFAIVLAVGVWIGSQLQYQPTSSSPSKVDLIMRQLEDLYVDSVNTDDLLDKTVEHLLTELDPHSSYIPAKDLEAVNEPMEGSFDGIGVEFNIQKDTILVVAPISGGPSESVGILAGDKIVTVDSAVIAGTGIKNKDVFDLLRGQRGTKVKVGILRRGEKNLIDFDITRGKIPIHSIDVAYMVQPEVGYIKVNRFSATTPQEFEAASEQLLEEGMQKLILDLRNNPGGYLGAAIHMSNAFLEEGQLIVYTEGRSRAREEYYADNSGQLIHTEVVVLLDEGSASASEIVAGAIQDNDRGMVAGRRSFGKGLVQEQFAYTDGSAYRITTQRYYTPTGRCIQKPYTNGDQEGYHDDFMDRLEAGELLSQDSIQFADSLQFVTPKGKIVYGGGGIMPDLFIPMDTTSYHKSLSKASRKGLLRNFAFSYTDKHRADLEGQSMDDYLQFFEVSSSVLKDFAAYCQQEKVDMYYAALSASDKELLQLQLKAFIARNIWNDAGFYPVIHQLDETFQAVLKEQNKLSLQH